MKKIILALSLLSSLVHAGLEDNKVFKIQGSKQITTITTTNYAATRQLLYYIPKSVDLKLPTTVVFYLHGGNSNMTQERATGTADAIFYSNDGIFTKKEGMKDIADKLNFIVIMPTTTEGWNDFTPQYLKEILSLVRTELNPDPNRIYLSGHSMGAMGIARATNKLVDQFAMIIPVSGGYQPHLMSFDEAGPFFNTRVWVTVGEKDFDSFKKWNEDFSTYLHSKSIQDYFQSELPLLFEYEKHPLTHNPNIPLLMQRFTSFLSETQRNMFQSDLFGFVINSKPNNIVKDSSYKRYFWLEALEFRDFDANENSLKVNFRLYSKNNKIDLYIDRAAAFTYDYRPHLKKVRLYLSEKLFDLSKPIEINLYTKKGIMIEKTSLFNEIAPRDNSKALEVVQSTGDKGFEYESFVDLVLPKN